MNREGSFNLVFVCYPLCLTDLLIIVYKQKHVEWYVKAKKLIKQNMSFNTPVDHDWSLTQPLQWGIQSADSIYAINFLT